MSFTRIAAWCRVSNCFSLLMNLNLLPLTSPNSASVTIDSLQFTPSRPFHLRQESEKISQHTATNLNAEFALSQIFENQVAIVTGAGSPGGIGFATARRFLAYGAKVAITSTTDRIVKRANELDASGTKVFSFVADLTFEAQAKALVDSVLSWYGRIDILVNNAGMIQVGQPMNSGLLENLSYSSWQRQLAITLNSAFLMARSVLPTMKKQNRSEEHTSELQS